MMYNNFINFWKPASCIRLIYYLILSWNKLLFMQEDEWLRWKYRMFRKFREINMDNTFPHIFVSTGRQEVVPTELHILTAWTYEYVTLHGRRDFSDVIKGKTLNTEDYWFKWRTFPRQSERNLRKEEGSESCHLWRWGSGSEIQEM